MGMPVKQQHVFPGWLGARLHQSDVRITNTFDVAYEPFLTQLQLVPNTLDNLRSRSWRHEALLHRGRNQPFPRSRLTELEMLRI